MSRWIHVISPSTVISCLFLILVMRCAPVSASTAPLDADSVYQFAAMNFEHGDYMTAMVEFKRFLFFFPSDPRAAEAAFKIGMSNFHGARYPQAIEAFESVTRTFAASEYATEAVFMIAQSYLRLNDSESAVGELSSIAARAGEPTVRDRALYQIGWIDLKNGDLSSARGAFNAISNKRHYRIEELIGRLDIGEAPHKQPWLAGIFSIIPGGGYLYTGLYREAGVSFLFNMGLAAAAHESFDNDLNVLGGMLSLVNIGFYSGGIYGGINAAQKYNQRSYDEFVNELQAQVAPRMAVRIEPTGRSLLFSFNYSF